MVDIFCCNSYIENLDYYIIVCDMAVCDIECDGGNCIF